MIRMSGICESRPLPLSRFQTGGGPILGFGQSFSLLRPSARIPLLDPLCVPSLRWALPVAQRYMLRDSLDESVERFDVGNVLPTKPRESRAEVLVESHAIRGERIPQLPREPSAADVPVGQDDRLSMMGRDQFTQAEHGRALIDHTNVARDAKGPQRALVVLALDDDRRASVLLRQIFEDALQVVVELLPVHRPLTERPADDKGCAQEAIIYRPPDMRIVPGEEEVNFERVTKVYREESGKKTLVALEADFYDKLASYIARLDESANKEAQKDPNSPKALLLQDELRKVRKRRDQIFTYRERKLALLASSRASGAEVDVPNLPAQERGLFDGMVALLGKSRTDAFGGSAFGVEPAPPPAASGVAPAKEKLAGMKVVRAEETRRAPVAPSLKDHVLVHVLEDVPPFAGIDTTYRLKKEDVVTLPKTIAQILVDRGKARIVQMPDAAR